MVTVIVLLFSTVGFCFLLSTNDLCILPEVVITSLLECFKIDNLFFAELLFIIVLFASYLIFGCFLVLR